MEHPTRENPFPKRGRKAGALSDGSEVEGPPLYKKPKHCRSSPDIKPHSNALSEDDMQDQNHLEDLVSIRHAVVDLQLMGKDFYQEQQRRYEEMQSLGREFHQLQQKRYDGLRRWIDDTERRVDRQLREIKQLKKKIKSEPNKNKDVLSGLKYHAMEDIPPDKRYIDVEDQDAEERTAPISSTQILPSLPLTADGRNLASPSYTPKSTHRSELETEPSGREIRENGKQPPSGSGLINKAGEIPKPTSPIKPATDSLSVYVDPSDGDDEDENGNGPSKDFRMGRSLRGETPQSVGLLNDDGAVEGMEIGPGSLDVEIYLGQQHHSPPATPSSNQDQTRPRTATRDTTPTPDRTKITSPQPMRSLRKRRSIDYYKAGPSIDESDGPNSSPLNETPPKTFPKTPVRRKARKKGDESQYLDSAKENTIKHGTDKKKSASKSSGGMKFGSMDKFVVKQTLPTPTPARETDNDQSHFLPIPDNLESKPNRNMSSSLGALQPRTPSKGQLTGVFQQAPGVPLDKSVVDPRSSRELSDAAAASARYRAVRTSTIS